MVYAENRSIIPECYDVPKDANPCCLICIHHTEEGDNNVSCGHPYSKYYTQKVSVGQALINGSACDDYYYDFYRDVNTFKIRVEAEFT